MKEKTKKHARSLLKRIDANSGLDERTIKEIVSHYEINRWPGRVEEKGIRTGRSLCKVHDRFFVIPWKQDSKGEQDAWFPDQPIEVFRQDSLATVLVKTTTAYSTKDGTVLHYITELK